MSRPTQDHSQAAADWATCVRGCVWLQITTTLPVRTTFYSQVTDITRIFFEVVMHLCLVVVLYLQASVHMFIPINHNMHVPHSQCCYVL